MIGLGLWVIGVPNPILFGVLAAIMRFVPYIGAAISALLPLIVAAAVDPGWSMVIATAALFLVVEPIAGHVVEPLLYGHSTGLSPIAVILAGHALDLPVGADRPRAGHPASPSASWCSAATSSGSGTSTSSSATARPCRRRRSSTSACWRATPRRRSTRAGCS